MPPNPNTLDVVRYSVLLTRAAGTALQPVGVDEDTLRDWLFSNASYYAPPGFLPTDRPGFMGRLQP